MSQIHQLAFIFVLGCAGDRGNEGADQTVDSAVMEEGQIVDQADIYKML